MTIKAARKILEHAVRTHVIVGSVDGKRVPECEHCDDVHDDESGCPVAIMESALKALDAPEREKGLHFWHDSRNVSHYLCVDNYAEWIGDGPDAKAHVERVAEFLNHDDVQQFFRVSSRRAGGRASEMILAARVRAVRETIDSLQDGGWLKSEDADHIRATLPAADMSPEDATALTPLQLDDLQRVADAILDDKEPPPDVMARIKADVQQRAEAPPIPPSAEEKD